MDWLSSEEKYTYHTVNTVNPKKTGEMRKYCTEILKIKVSYILPIKWPSTIYFPYYRHSVNLLLVLFQHSSWEQKYFKNFKKKIVSIERGWLEDSEDVKFLHKSYLEPFQNQIQR